MQRITVFQIPAIQIDVKHRGDGGAIILELDIGAAEIGLSARDQAFQSHYPECILVEMALVFFAGDDIHLIACLLMRFPLHTVGE